MRRIRPIVTVRAKAPIVVIAATGVLALTGCAAAVTGEPIAGQSDGSSAAGPLTPTGVLSEPAAPSGPTGPSGQKASSETTPAQTVAASEQTGSSPTGSGSAAAEPSSSPKKNWKLPEPEPGRPTNEFGDIAAKPGESSGIRFTDDDGRPGGTLVFVVRKLTLDPKCQPNAPKPHRGHFLKIDIEVEPHDMSPGAIDRWSGSFSASSWIAFDAKGTAQPGSDTDQADGCLPTSAELPYIDGRALGKDTLLSGSVVLDVASPKGTVLLDLQTDGGWEYHYG